MPDSYFAGAGTTKADYLRFKLAASGLPQQTQQPVQSLPTMPPAATGSSGLQGYPVQFPSVMPTPTAPAAMPVGVATQTSQNKWAAKTEAAQRANAWAKGLVK
jgi:predicted DsbA family dithiol-disulfide isomerase